MATNSEVVFTRDQSIAEVLEELIDSAKRSVEAALYRFNSRRLAEALQKANDRGLKVRLVLDHNKYEESQATRQLLSNSSVPFRLTYGKNGPGSKMHHKFVLVDGRSEFYPGVRREFARPGNAARGTTGRAAGAEHSGANREGA